MKLVLNQGATLLLRVVRNNAASSGVWIPGEERPYKAALDRQFLTIGS